MIAPAQSNNDLTEFLRGDFPFTTDGKSWRIAVGGKIIPADFNSRGAALAGIKTERARIDARKSKTEGNKT